jgi:hypothetical protein
MNELVVWVTIAVVTDALMNNPYVCVTITVVIGVVVALSLWLGRGLTIKKDKNGFTIETKEKAAQAAAVIIYLTH